MAWAPKYGLKGMIDASVRVKVEANKNESDVKVMPLEFKTGKVPKDQARLFSLLKLSYRILYLSDVYHTIYLRCLKLFFFQLVLVIFVQEHCAQVILYTLLMSERYFCFIPLFCFCFFSYRGIVHFISSFWNAFICSVSQIRYQKHVDTGLLCYLQSDQTQVVPFTSVSSIFLIFCLLNILSL